MDFPILGSTDPISHLATRQQILPIHQELGGRIGAVRDYQSYYQELAQLPQPALTLQLTSNFLVQELKRKTGLYSTILNGAGFSMMQEEALQVSHKEGSSSRLL